MFGNYLCYRVIKILNKKTQMETLSELINVVNRKRLSKIDVLDKTFLKSKSTNLYYKLYDAIERKQVMTDEEAGVLIYGTGRDDPRYRMLKSRLKEKVLKTVMLLQTNDSFYHEEGRLYYECISHAQIIEVLIFLTGTTKLIYEMIKENYSIALNGQFYDIVKNYSYYLLSYYSLIGDKRSFLKEQKNYKEYIQLAQKKQDAKFLYFKSSIEFEHDAPITDSLLKEVKINLKQLQYLRNELRNIEIDFYYFFLALEFYEKNNELDKVMLICNEAEKLMLSNPTTYTNTRKIVILLFKLNTLLTTKQFLYGINLINDESSTILENNYNWFRLKEIEFKLHLQNKKTDDAFKVYKQVHLNKSFKRQGERIIEKWKIYYAYFVFMDSYLNNGDYKFSLSKFLNEVPINSKDKSGYNFAIRVIEMLFMFGRKEYNIVFQKMESLRIYRTRYLNDNAYKRNHLFLSTLLKAEKTGFKGREMEKADWTEIRELRKQNNHIIADWEIMPYEELWDIIVDLAKK
ncbi:MAG: hypothetical protein JWN78_714 [Bacteroidota bacterium]|nr:hypothetical protein [Bacteroidota bacterium]